MSNSTFFKILFLVAFGSIRCDQIQDWADNKTKIDNWVAAIDLLNTELGKKVAEKETTEEELKLAFPEGKTESAELKKTYGEDMKKALKQKELDDLQKKVTDHRNKINLASDFLAMNQAGAAVKFDADKKTKKQVIFDDVEGLTTLKDPKNKDEWKKFLTAEEYDQKEFIDAINKATKDAISAGLNNSGSGSGLSGLFSKWWVWVIIAAVILLIVAIIYFMMAE